MVETCSFGGKNAVGASGIQTSNDHDGPPATLHDRIILWFETREIVSFLLCGSGKLVTVYTIQIIESSISAALIDITPPNHCF
jgi:hypothetical protein